ncbi:MAG TPA: bifunctional diguanylate cyclase/phosphodiesterase, partial [Macromonas sp.]|nr:bifunctional diguanylate cyclase/phosphodiesterase [Macromonas sp.]
DDGRDDEVGRLARGFDTMRRSIATQQTEIRHLAYWDRLTGLPNREQFRTVLRQAIEAERTTGESVTVLTLNLDRFKHVNDVLGYTLGDALLQAVATRLQLLVVRQGDLVARLGGDEFALLLSRTDAQGAVTMGRRIATAFETPLALEQQTVDLSASMGVACWPGDAHDADTLMSRAEIAMRSAKARTTGLCRYEPALDSSSNQTLSLLTDLRLALEHQQLRLFVQPKVALASGAVVALEALVRWEHPHRGLVPPMEFIPFAEQTGFVRQLTQWMLQETCRQWAGLQLPGQTLRVAINLSTRDLMDQDFAAGVADLLRQHGVPTSGLCLEITESAIMDDPQRAEVTLNKLAALGFKLSIDDFGTGYSSLAYLKRLPVNELKIDKSFVMGMETDDSDAKIVRSTIDLAHNLGLSVVAEGVENPAILQTLRELQCDEAQGYHISRPMPVKDFVRWRDAWLQRTV